MTESITLPGDAPYPSEIQLGEDRVHLVSVCVYETHLAHYYQSEHARLQINTARTEQESERQIQLI